MKKIDIKGESGTSSILVGESVQALPAYIPAEGTVMITDGRVRSLYGHAFPDCPVIEIGEGEGIKTLDTLYDIFDRLIDLEADRSTMIVGVGGGIVCDITGFAASTYLRGVRFGFVSTTLLSQVDASVGGKNGVNFKGYKNMVGVFNQPQFVICDPETLATLPRREILCGYAEIIKHAAIADAGLFSFLERNYKQALDLERRIVERSVYDSVVIKSGIVNRDEREQGERRKLNFGHTFGHAVEKTAGLPHGESVAVGMALAARLSVKRGMLSDSDGKRIQDLISHFELPVKTDADRGMLLDALRRDKKREGDKIHFVLLDAIGRAVVQDVDIAELDAAINEW